MPSGGRREANGRANPNRVDLNVPKPPVARFQGQEYGQQAAQVAQQQATPPPASAAAPTIPSFVPLDAPTTRPDEPVTHGLPSGPGAGPEALGLPADDSLAFIRAAQQKFPNPDLLRLLLDVQARTSQ